MTDEHHTQNDGRHQHRLRPFHPDDEPDELDDSDDDGYNTTQGWDTARPATATSASSSATNMPAQPWNSWLDHDDQATCEMPVLMDRSTGTPRPVLSRLSDYKDNDPEHRRRSPTGFIVGAVIAVIVTAVVFLLAAGGEARDHELASWPSQTHVTSLPAFPTTAPTSPGVLDCPQVLGSFASSGTWAGDRDSGQGVVFAFQAAYYTAREGQQAADLFSNNPSPDPDAPPLPDAQTIQAGIDSIPLGTQYCVQIEATDIDDQWRVVVTEQRPGQKAIPYAPSLVRTETADGQAVITSMTPA